MHLEDIIIFLCIFAAELAKKLFHLKFKPMTEDELEKQIRLKKNCLAIIKD